MYRRSVTQLSSGAPYKLATSRRVARSTTLSASANRKMATMASFKVPKVENEPNHHYAPNTPSRLALDAALTALRSKSPQKIPLHIGATLKTTPELQTQFIPSSHTTTLATSSSASAADVTAAISSALSVKHSWSSLPFPDRAAIFLKAADLISTKYRYQLLALTMLGQGKSAWQAEIDAAAELADFLRFNVAYAEELYAQQPAKNSPNVWNRVEYRPLEGFVYAISPFNFTAIGGNLAAAPALMGNVVLWKPSPAALASNYLVYQILLEAGLPEGVIQWVPGDAEVVTKAVLAHKEFAGLHYTGSTEVFRGLYGKISEGVREGRYKGYPRIVGETGGKNFHLIHASAERRNAVVQTVRGAFEYQGQKCSACSRVYIPESISKDFLAELKTEVEGLKVGPPEGWENFIGPVIHRESFEKLRAVIDAANKDKKLKLLTGGKYDDSEGFYIHPTVYVAKDPAHELFNKELFGPVLVVYVYKDSEWEDILKTVEKGGGGYALTGSVFAKDRSVIRQAEEALREAAGNFYINCKSTGAVVGQQPFGGARASGTNDKAGSMSLLTRFVSARSIKEEFVGMEKVGYPSNEV
ncbi:Aldehyde/histidinol dehydrogenase [Pyronema domesticum]|uniref:Multifunctional fusion protein n=1 Tax=Pyronema omphalodes (strain CBS 100304) TaxID=1076935 RepID=U4L950_PYROM|nr:Aldehyde/histidinol dehydrogenase [Pyronema domesticum]CCX14886.1 Similar to Delta-1-pyrroline-5-carboxylate dehydrogenase, mitochondrial; acc. no. Q9P8I0 [Pyronema omphalodes CBS 100304]